MGADLSRAANEEAPRPAGDCPGTQSQTGGASRASVGQVDSGAAPADDKHWQLPSVSAVEKLEAREKRLRRALHTSIRADAACRAPPLDARGPAPPAAAGIGAAGTAALAVASAPIPIHRGGWTSNDIDMLCRDLADLGDDSLSTSTALTDSSLPSEALSAAGLGRPSSSTRPSSALSDLPRPRILARMPSPSHSRSLPTPGSSRAAMQPPPAPRCRPSLPMFMPPKLALPPASPASDFSSSSPLSSSGVSMITPTPPTPHYVQVGFHVGSPDVALHVLSRDPATIVSEAQQRRLSTPLSADARWHGRPRLRARSL
jgi:hypothetical protein